MDITLQEDLSNLDLPERGHPEEIPIVLTPHMYSQRVPEAIVDIVIPLSIQHFVQPLSLRDILEFLLKFNKTLKTFPLANPIPLPNDPDNARDCMYRALVLDFQADPSKETMLFPSTARSW